MALKKHQLGYLSVFGGILIHLTLGTIYLWGNINVYITSYYRLHFDNSLSLTTSSFIFPSWYFFQTLGMYLATIVGNRLGFKRTAVLAMLSFAGVTFLCSFIENFTLFMAIYGTLPAIALGFAYMIPLHCGWAYFPKHRGKVNGIISTAFGISVLPFNPIATHLANPDDVIPSIEVK